MSEQELFSKWKDRIVLNKDTLIGIADNTFVRFEALLNCWNTRHPSAEELEKVKREAMELGKYQALDQFIKIFQPLLEELNNYKEQSKLQPTAKEKG